MAAMTVYSDKHVKDSELEYTTNGYSIALDAVLDIAGNTDQFIMNKLTITRIPGNHIKICGMEC